MCDILSESLSPCFSGMLELHIIIKKYAIHCHMILSFAFNLVHIRHLATGGRHMEHCPMCRTSSTLWTECKSNHISARMAIVPFLQRYFDSDKSSGKKPKNQQSLETWWGMRPKSISLTPKRIGKAMMTLPVPHNLILDQTFAMQLSSGWFSKRCGIATIVDTSNEKLYEII